MSALSSTSIPTVCSRDRVPGRLPGNSKIVLSEAVLVRVIVIESLDINSIDYDYEHAHEHGELN